MGKSLEDDTVSLRQGRVEEVADRKGKTRRNSRPLSLLSALKFYSLFRDVVTTPTALISRKM